MSELGRVNILTEVAMLSAYQAKPREGHLRQLLRLFMYMKRKPKLTLYFDPELPVIPDGIFDKNTESLKENYCDELPYKMPTPLGKGVDICWRVSFVSQS